MDAPQQVDAVLLRRSHGIRNVGLAIAGAGCALSFAIHGDGRVLWMIGLGTVGGVLALLGLEGSVRRIAASLDAGAVRVGNKVVALGSSIRSGWIERGPEGNTVYLDRGLRPAVRLDAHDDLEARTLLRAVERDPSQALVRFSSSVRFAALGGSIGGQLFARSLFEQGPPSLLCVAACCGLVFALFFLLNDEMSIGADGVLLTRLLRRRFVPFADIESANVEGVSKVVMHTRTHGTLVLRLRAAAAEAAVEQIQASMASIGGRSELVRNQLRREGPNVHTWLARLRALTDRGSYRAVGLGGDALWRVMDDPAATGSERAAAAVVVGAVATLEERARLRAAAARIASPRVRVAIERAADPTDEAELAVALAAIDDSMTEG